MRNDSWRPPEMLSFGPVIEQVIQARATGTNQFLDLDTGTVADAIVRNHQRSRPPANRVTMRIVSGKRWIFPAIRRVSNTSPGCGKAERT